jgi:hypothetical protein
MRAGGAGAAAALDHRRRARSKGLAVMADGATGTAVYADRLRREEHGWRISYRKITRPKR